MKAPAVQNIILDIHKTSDQAKITVMEGDAGTTLWRFCLVEDGKPVRLDETAKATILLRDHTGASVLFNTCTVRGDFVEYTVNGLSAGRRIGQVTVYTGAMTQDGALAFDKFCSAYFTVTVCDEGIGDEDLTERELGVLEGLQGDVSALENLFPLDSDRIADGAVVLPKLSAGVRGQWSDVFELVKPEGEENWRDDQGLLYELSEANPEAGLDATAMLIGVNGGDDAVIPNGGNIVIPYAVLANGTVYRVSSSRAEALSQKTNLKSVDIRAIMNADMELFWGSKNLRYVRIPVGCEYIWDHAFANLPAMKDVFVPYTVKSIAADAFADNPSMTVTIDNYPRAVEYDPSAQESNATVVYLRADPNAYYTKEESDTNLAAGVADAKADAAANLASAKEELNAAIEAAKTEASDNLDAAKTELKGDVADAKAEAQDNLDAAKTELNAAIEAAKSDAAANLESAKTELAGDIAETNGSVAALEARFPVATADIADGAVTADKLGDDVKSALSTALRREVVEALPETDPDVHTVYMVKDANGGDGAGDVYDEYLYVDGKWEHIGSTRTDLSGYPTRDELSETLTEYAKTADVDVDLEALRQELYGVVDVVETDDPEQGYGVFKQIYAGNGIVFVTDTSLEGEAFVYRKENPGASVHTRIPAYIRTPDGTVYTVTTIEGGFSKPSGDSYFAFEDGSVEEIFLPKTVTKYEAGCFLYDEDGRLPISFNATFFYDGVRPPESVCAKGVTLIDINDPFAVQEYFAGKFPEEARRVLYGVVDVAGSDGSYETGDLKIGVYHEDRYFSFKRKDVTRIAIPGYFRTPEGKVYPFRTFQSDAFSGETVDKDAYIFLPPTTSIFIGKIFDRKFTNGARLKLFYDGEGAKPPETAYDPETTDLIDIRDPYAVHSAMQGDVYAAIEAAKASVASDVDGKLAEYDKSTAVDEKIETAKTGAVEEAGAATDAKLADYAKSADVTEQVETAVGTVEGEFAEADANLKEEIDTAVGGFANIAALLEAYSLEHGPILQNLPRVTELVRDGKGAQYFPVGYEFEIPDYRQNDNVVWIVRDHDTIKPADDALSHSLFLETKYFVAGTVANDYKTKYNEFTFDAQEAWFVTSAELPAGAYKITAEHLVADDEQFAGTYTFTLTFPIPAGGCGVIYDGVAANFDAKKATKIVSLRTYPSPGVGEEDAKLPDMIEEATLTKAEDAAAAEGTDLNATEGVQINALIRAMQGSDNYAQSAIRQWLTNEESDWQKRNRWWKPQTVFDRAPDWNNKFAPFGPLFASAFKTAVQPAKILTATNTYFEVASLDGTEFSTSSSYTLQDKFFLLDLGDIAYGYPSAKTFNPELYGGDDRRLAWYGGLTDARDAIPLGDSDALRNGSAMLRTPAWVEKNYGGASVRIGWNRLGYVGFASCAVYNFNYKLPITVGCIIA